MGEGVGSGGLGLGEGLLLFHCQSHGSRDVASDRASELASSVIVNPHEGILCQVRFAAALRRSRYRYDLAMLCYLQ